MSFSKAQDLIRLARLAASRRSGISLDEICKEFGISHRTAQRMTDALETTFMNVEAEDGDDRRRRWRVADPMLDRLQPRQETAVEALEIAGRSTQADGRLRHASALAELRDGLLARLAPKDAARTEADAEAVLTAMGSVTRPGPRVNLTPKVLDAVIETLRGPFRLQLRYGEPDAPEQVIEPHSCSGAPQPTKQRDPVIAPPQPDAPPPICRGSHLVYHFAAAELGGSIQVSVISTIGRAPPRS